MVGMIIIMSQTESYAYANEADDPDESRAWLMAHGSWLGFPWHGPGLRGASPQSTQTGHPKAMSFEP